MLANPKLSRFPRSKVWDPRTQKIVDALRAYIHRHPQPTISKLQQGFVKAKPLDDTFYCFQQVLGVPSDELRDLLLNTIDAVKQVEYQKPVLAPVIVEWVGQKTVSACSSKASYSASEQRFWLKI